MVGDRPTWCVVLFATLTLSEAVRPTTSEPICERGRSWWDRQRSTCVPCTRCDPTRKLAVKLPCELHRDTVCQSLFELKIFPFNTPSRNDSNNSAVNSDYEYYEYVDYDGEMSDGGDDQDWDLQASALTIATSGCVVFFVVVLCLSLYHAKQWRILKQALKSDVQDLSAKLKLMEAGAEPPSEPALPSDHHIYCNIHITKDGFHGPANTKGPGNVYTQEKHNH